ncbi:MAG: hypothetical protein ABR589_08580 [Chthoniobacterales bacterium]
MIDGIKIAKANYTYDRATNRLRYQPTADLALGTHSVKIVAVDPQGLRKQKTWSFTVEAENTSQPSV